VLGGPKGEEQEIEFDRREELALRKAELENVGLEADIAAREKYANRIYALIVGWLIAILIILLLQGFLVKRQITLNFPLIGHRIFRTAIHFELSAAVLLALIGGTTASVLGLFVIVANYFFPKRITKDSN
jgi:hypothetical protein